MDATRAGMGCGSCKAHGARSWWSGPAAATREEDPSVHYYVPGVPLTQAGARFARSASSNLKSVSAVFDALAGGKEDAASKPGLASLLQDALERRVRGRARCALHQRSRPRQHPEGRHVLRGPADARRRHAAPRNCGASPTWRRSITCRMVKLTGGQRIDLLGVQEGGSAEGVARSRHAVRARLCQDVPHLQELRRHRILPLRRGRQHRARA